MSAPLPQRSTIPRSGADGHITNTGAAQRAANMLPAMTHVKNIGKKLDETLQQSHVYDEIRKLLSAYIQDEKLDATKQEEVLQGLRQAGLFGDAITGGVGPQVGFAYDPSISDSSSSVPSGSLIGGGGKLVPGKRYLHVRVRPGKAFVENILEEPEIKAGGFHVIRLSMEFAGARCLSAPVPATVEPQFNESFLFRLQPHDEDQEVESGLISLEQLAESNEPLRVVVVRESSLGTTTLVSLAQIEWRKVLVHGRLSLNVELKSGDELQIPVGLLCLDLEVVPLKMPPNPKELPVFVELGSLQKQLIRDTELLKGVEARFHAYARAWWNDYNTIRPLHQTRLIQMFGVNEYKQQACVTTFVSPIRADRCLDSPLHAARFVRLIPYKKDTKVGGQRTEIWYSPHTILARRYGDLEDHASLLCSLFLGFGLDAYVAIGTAHEKGAHIWVITRGGGSNGQGVTMWESLTGQRFELDQSAEQKALVSAGLAGKAPQTNGGSLAARSGVSPLFPFHRIHCLFNHRAFYANNQMEDQVSLVDWNLDNTQSWKAMNQRALEVLPKRAPVYMRPSTILPAAEEKALERNLREMINNYRREYANLSTSWSEDISYMLAPALASYENERITGSTFGNDEFQQAVKRTVPNNCVFKAVPFQFTSLTPSVVFASLLQSRALLDLIVADGTDMRFGLRSRIVVYPEDFVAVWIMVASIKRADDFLAAPLPAYQ